MDFNLKERTIYLTIAGSHAYGLATPESDIDYRGVAIPPLSSYIGINNKFEQIVDTENKHVYKHYPDLVEPEADMQVMELTKFARLAADCNPSVIELLYIDPKFHIIKHPIMDRLIENRHLFLSKAAKARFSGYALSRLKRINRHMRWLRNPPTHKPTRTEFGLPEHGTLSQDQIGAAEALIQKELDEFMVEQTHLSEDVRVELSNAIDRVIKATWRSLFYRNNNVKINYVLLDDLRKLAPQGLTGPDATMLIEWLDNLMADYPVGDGKPYESTAEALYWGVARNQGFSENFIEMLNCEKKYRAAKKDWDSYQHWLKTRNPARAEIEKKHSFDTKNASHLVRLLRMSREILERGEVIVFRPDAEELKAIKNGAWTYEQIVEFAEAEDQALNELVKQSKLPKIVDRNKIHDIVYNIVMEFNR